MDESGDSQENLCRRCGACCFEKVYLEDEDAVVTTDIPCAHFNLATRLCRVYARRHEINPRCADRARGIASRIFPADCPYVRDLRGYKPPLRLDEHPEYANAVAAAFRDGSDAGEE